MQVFKFGGASVKDAAAIRNVASILSNYTKEELVVVISAMGKTTNALEAVTEAYYQQTGQANTLLNQLREQHAQIVQELFGTQNHTVIADLEKIFGAIEKWLAMPPTANYNFVYDQIVSAGELVSTTLIAAYLNEQGINTQWLDVRNLVRTDNTYREAVINWPETTKRIQSTVLPLVKNQMVVTQGFLGGTIENFTTTLGREGSDFTAAIFSNALDAQQMSVWKDVPGILSGDPRVIEDVVKIPKLSYYEAIEMTYYGAKVIHPKTIKPLQNKNIPLAVRSFSQPEAIGTTIHLEGLSAEEQPPVIVLNKNQILLSITTKDFSFVAEENLSTIYHLCSKFGVKANLSQNAAISFSVCVDNVPYKVTPLIEALSEQYKVLQNDGLELITIRHYNTNFIAKHTQGREVLLEQKSRNTIQMLVR